MLYLGDVAIEVLYKDIKNVHLRVFPPDGRVCRHRDACQRLLRGILEDKRAWIEAKRSKTSSRAPFAVDL